ncbi:hypothetical protein EFB08_16505 [Rufibacter latericius]|uniref:Uncharacterized protein n=1 Tax=Rufibacter latericius TaxID=2487040 RepID=A0A3M9MHN0_9BACT|nr:hypothetical protein EFB08_16505 [Rufibacter latericius]
MKIVLVIIYIIALVELTIGWSQNPKKKFYRKLFNIKIYIITLFCSFLLLIIPLYDLIYDHQFGNVYLAIPFTYLILFKIADGISLLVNKRHIIIVGRGDNFPKEHKWYVDSVLSFTALFGAVVIPVLIRECINN